MWLYVISFLLFPSIDCAISKRCSAKFCDPNWTPFPNMVAAMRGYNIRSGNPIHNHGDPGFMGQIFLPTKINAQGKIELETGITASELSYCQRSLTSQSFTTMNSYRKYVAETSSSGMNLQIGTDTEVTAGVNLKGVDLSAKTVIPKPFERAWSDSRDFKKLTKFFSEKHGLVSIAMGTCTMYEVKLDRFYLPPFTIPFQSALIKLFDVKDDPEYLKKATFRRFIQEYGTHFLIRTKMGAEYVYRTKFSKNARKLFNAETLKSCNYVQGLKIFGIQLEKDKSRCKASDIQKINQLSSADIQASIITKGSRPTDIEHWATQKFTPVPLKFELSPIVNLMTDQYINKAELKTSKGVRITSLEIRKWFLPLYFDYCSSMNVDCGHKKGCGIDDKCPVDAICVPGGRKHECTQWTQWTCTVNCGQGTRKRRTRRCTGCKGVTEQFAAKKCAKQKECYKHHPQCRWQYTPWNKGSRDVHYLDRHKLDCGDHYTLNYFHLVRDSRHKNYRYKYKCCQTQLRCHTHRWRNTRTTYVSGGNMVYLDRQSVSCPHQQLLSGFWQRRPSKNYIYYRYRCCELPQSKSCFYKYTTFTDDGNGRVYYLDRQAVYCPYRYAISYFGLRRNKRGNRVRYHVRCCKINPN